jgi:uncharacterized membrane protein
VSSSEVGAASGLLAAINQMGNEVGVASIGMVFFAVSEEIATPPTISRAFAWSLVYLFVMSAITAMLTVASGRTELTLANKDR